VDSQLRNGDPQRERRPECAHSPRECVLPLVWGRDRDLLVPEAKRRAALWTSRVWPGALLVGGEIVGVWRRSAADVSIEAWCSPSSKEREAVEAEAVSLLLPGLNDPIAVRWSR
jgi:Winged helix DNA-binding domain